MTTLVPLLMALAVAHAVQFLLTDPEAPRVLLRNSGLHSQLERELTKRAQEMLTRQDSPLPLTEREAAAFVQQVLPSERIRVLLDGALDDLRLWLTTGGDRPEIVLDLSDVRRALPAAIRSAAVAKVEALPVCSAAQAVRLAATYRGGLPECKSPSAAFNALVVDTVLKGADLENLLPARIDLALEIAKEHPEFWGVLAKTMVGIRLGLVWAPWGWGTAAAFLTMLAAINLQVWQRALLWVSAPVLISGGVLLAAFLAVVELLTAAITAGSMSGDAF